MKNSLIGLSDLKVFLIILFFFAIGILIYSNTFESPFVFDDKVRILENPAIRVDKLNVKNLWNAAFGKYSARSRPIGNISFALNYYFHQYESASYHLTNILVHIINGVLLWLFLKKTLSLESVKLKKSHAEWMAFSAALLWFVNPVQTQSVTYIIQRLNSMAALFFLLSFVCYISGRLTASRGRKWTWFLSAAFGWFLALGCKQNAATLPFFIILYEWFFLQDLNVDWFKQNFKYFAIVIAVFIVVVLIFLGSQPVERLTSISDFADKEFTITERVLTQSRVVIYYLSLFLYPNPSRQNLDYDFPLSYSLLNPATTLFSIIGIIGLIALGVILTKKQRLISFCIFWFLGNLVIESSIIPVAIINEHRIYLPSMMAGLIPVLLAFCYVKYEWLRIGLLCLVIALFSYWTYERNKIWENKITLWTDCIKKSPNKARPYYNLGEAYANSKMPEEAAPLFFKSLALDPDNAPAHHNLAVILAQKGKIDEAIGHYQKALQINPNSVETHIGLAALFSKQNNFPYAITHYRKALRLHLKNAEAQHNLGDPQAQQGQMEQAIKPLDRDVQIKSFLAEAHNNLGGQLLMQGNLNEAFDHLKQALSLNPLLPEAHNNMGIIMIRRGDLDAAIRHFQDAVRLNPDFAAAQNSLKRALAISASQNPGLADIQKQLARRPDDPVLHFKLGNLYLGKQEIDRAITEYERALELQPKYLGAQNNLAMALAADRQYDRALTAFEKLTALDPDNTVNYYNIAVLHALQNRVPQSIDWLKKALERGYQNWDLIKTDPDLANIRDSQEYRQLVKGH